MSPLSSALLALLARGPCSGYDLMRQMNLFWKAQHSQIYPSLARLEQDGFIRHVKVEQTDKPDKKIYSLTDAGTEALRRWLLEPAVDPYQRDEFLLKAYSLWLMEPDEAVRLFERRMEWIDSKLALMKERLAGLRAAYPDGRLPMASPDFSRYLLITRAISQELEQRRWCKWALSRIADGYVELPAEGESAPPWG